MTGPWFDMYLKDRRSIVLNHNPFLMLQDDPRPEYSDQVCTELFVYTSRYYLLPVMMIPSAKA